MENFKQSLSSLEFILIYSSPSMRQIRIYTHIKPMESPENTFGYLDVFQDLRYCLFGLLYRNGILGSLMVSVGAGILSAFCPNYMSLVILRCLLGFGIGGGQIFALWFIEFIPTQNRGSWMITYTGFWTFGTIIEASLGWVGNIFNRWNFCLVLYLWFSAKAYQCFIFLLVCFIDRAEV